MENVGNPAEQTEMAGSADMSGTSGHLALQRREISYLADPADGPWCGQRWPSFAIDAPVLVVVSPEGAILGRYRTPRPRAPLSERLAVIRGNPPGALCYAVETPEGWCGVLPGEARPA